MPKLAANLTMLFQDVPFLDRFAAAKQAGFKYVEFLLPYDHPAEKVKEALDKNGLQVVLFNLPCGNWAGGDRGIGATFQRQHTLPDCRYEMFRIERLGVVRLQRTFPEADAHHTRCYSA